MSEPPKIKGAAIRTLLDWYRKTEGVEAYHRVFAQLSEEEKFALGGKSAEILPNVWYDARLAHRLCEIVLGPLPPHEQARRARDGARNGLRVLGKGVYQFVVKQIVTPSFYARHIQRLFRLLHDTGNRRIEMGQGEAISITSGWPGHHPLLCLLVNETMGAVFESLGCRDVTVERVQCVSDGAPDCRCRVRWSR